MTNVFIMLTFRPGRASQLIDMARHKRAQEQAPSGSLLPPYHVWLAINNVARLLALIFKDVFVRSFVLLLPLLLLLLELLINMHIKS